MSVSSAGLRGPVCIDLECPTLCVRSCKVWDGQRPQCQINLTIWNQNCSLPYKVWMNLSHNCDFCLVILHIFCSFPDFSVIFDTCRSPPALKLSSCQSQSPDPFTSQCICSPVPHYLPCIPVYTSPFPPVICLTVYPIFAFQPLFLFLACLFLTTACIARLPLACLVRPCWLIMCCGTLR